MDEERRKEIEQLQAYFRKHLQDTWMSLEDALLKQDYATVVSIVGEEFCKVVAAAYTVKMRSLVDPATFVRHVFQTTAKHCLEDINTICKSIDSEGINPAELLRMIKKEMEENAAVPPKPNTDIPIVDISKMNN